MPAYIAVITHANDSYHVHFPDFAGLTTAGTSMTEARTKATELLTLHIEELRAAGKKLPAPMKLEVIMADPSNQSGVAVMIEGREA
jgi:predicted RNase H-like HicB family nuclease